MVSRQLQVYSITVSIGLYGFCFDSVSAYSRFALEAMRRLSLLSKDLIVLNDILIRRLSRQCTMEQHCESQHAYS